MRALQVRDQSLGSPSVPSALNKSASRLFPPIVTGFGSEREWELHPTPFNRVLVELRPFPSGRLEREVGENSAEENAQGDDR
jgi:hypothetical protein